MNGLPLTWIVALAALAALALGFWLAALWWPASREPSSASTAEPPSSLPADWPLAPRPVFSAAERRLYRRLREALPRHVVLVKLPLLRLCQPTDAGRRRYWYRLLGDHHVAFAVSNASGRVLVAIDIEPRHVEPAEFDRSLRVKRSVFEACGIRYVSVSPEPLPSATELRSLLPDDEPDSAGAPRRPAAATSVDRSPVPLPAVLEAAHGPLPTRAVEPEPTLFLDSFFAPDEQPADPVPDREPGADDAAVGGIVVDTPPGGPDRGH